MCWSRLKQLTKRSRTNFGAPVQWQNWTYDDGLVVIRGFILEYDLSTIVALLNCSLPCEGDPHRWPHVDNWIYNTTHSWSHRNHSLQLYTSSINQPWLFLHCQFINIEIIKVLFKLYKIWQSLICCVMMIVREENIIIQVISLQDPSRPITTYLGRESTLRLVGQDLFVESH